jgi:SAM-dependent methyltransferase
MTNLAHVDERLVGELPATPQGPREGMKMKPSDLLPPRAKLAILRLASGIIPGHPVVHQVIRNHCLGEGLEIGPGRLPYCDRRTTTFVEKHPESLDGMLRPDIVADAADLPLPDGSQNYVFSSHVLEHAPDTIRVLKEWLRVLRAGGVIFLMLPHADRTFDRHRPKTTLEHHIADHDRVAGEPDHSHDAEAREGWEKLEDLPETISAHHAVFGDGTMWNFEHRLQHDAMHYHVWTQDEIVRLLQHLGLQIVFATEHVFDRRDSFIVVGRKSGC